MLNSKKPFTSFGFPHVEAEVRKPPVQSATEAENLDDLAHGQVVLVTARWILVVCSLIFVLWNPAPIGILRIQLILILTLAMANFYLHAQVLMKRTVLPTVIYAASICDLIVITAAVAIQDSFTSNTFVFYFPAIVAYSVAFAPQIIAALTGCVCVFYTLECLLTGSFSVGRDNLQVIFARVLMLVAVAVVSNVFAHIERGRREEATIARQELISELGKRSGTEDPDAEHIPAQIGRS
ncbi:MAG: hypothetical protein ACYDBJ_21790 [Aggregatilineales bacterium]